MKSVLLSLTFIFLHFIFSPLYSQKLSTPDSIKIGSPAPPIKVRQWLKGSPIAYFQKGQVYVVEFGATWCGPCRASIPHLTSLAKKYRKAVSVISVFVWEPGKNVFKDNYMPRVRRFLKDADKKIGYAVAVDDSMQTMSRTWIDAAGVQGIPSVFVIDANGIIQWIGLPGDLDPVIEQIVAGNFRPDIHHETKDEMKMFGGISNNIYLGNYQKALDTVDSFLRVHPDEYYSTAEKFKILLYMDEKKAYQYGWDLNRKGFNVEPGLFKLCSDFNAAMKKLKQPDWDLVLSLADRGINAAWSLNDKAAFMDLKSTLCFVKGDLKSSIQEEEKALQLLKQSPPDEANPVVLKYVINNLEQYKKQYAMQTQLSK